MLFCSQLFFVFFAVVFVLYWSLRGREARVWLLVLASYVFYATWSQWLALLILVTTLLDYALALGMDATAAPRLRKGLLLVSLTANLGLLAFFKYANFFLGSLDETLTALGATSALPTLQLILPIGISFYTFEAINYTVDVYRRKIPAERNLAHFLLFILFFPHLIAGPIVRAADFLPQVRRRKRWNWLRAQVGVQLFVLGLFKKLVLGDRLAQFVDPVYAHPDAFGSYAAWCAAVAFALQLYCDFSGYSDMALGTAHLLGYRLALNFDLPYLSRNIAQFWRRWHISLSSWLRDYLFIPLGGSRGGRWQTARNLLVTMTLAGLWHGAGWTFVIFGALHGVLLVGHRMLQDVAGRLPTLQRLLRSPVGVAGGVAATFLAWLLTLVFFRATSFANAGAVLERLFVPTAGLGTPLHDSGLWYSFALVALGHVLGWHPRWRGWLAQVPAAALGCGYAVAVTLAMLLTPDASRAFIYFQF